MDKILEVKKLKISFRTNSGTVKAVRDISFDLERGKTLAIVGESGSGKSVTSKAILGILAGNSIIEGGEVLYDGKDLLKIDEEEMHRIRGDKISMIFQDPLSSLNPIVKIGKQIIEAMLLKNKANRREAKVEYNRMMELLKANMLAACSADKHGRINELLNTFRSFNLKANEMQNAYNVAHEAAQQVLPDLEDLLFQIEKKQEVAFSRKMKEYLAKANKMRESFFSYHFTSELEQSIAAVQPLTKMNVKNGELPAEAAKTLKSFVALLKKMLEQEKPDFLAIGYYKIKNPSEDLAVKPRSQANSMAKSYLDQNFMNEFAELVSAGVRHSYETALGHKRELMPMLKEAIAYFKGEYTEKEALAYAENLSKKVQPSIDSMETIKDSTAYTFALALRTAVEKYFSAVKFNPKEQARFDKQTAKWQKRVDSGKKTDWKVIPLQLRNLDDLKKDIVSVVEHLQARYEAYLGELETDFRGRAAKVITYMEERATAIVYVLTKEMARERAIKLMDEVGIHNPRARFYQYPFEFSGGMRQRIVIAIALAADPDILICDEPTTALDVTIQAQILELINNLKKERNLSVIFITHDLGVVANMADDIAVMYAGKIVEYGTAEDIFYDPRHPYTWALLSSMPDLDTKEKLDAIPGTPPNMIYPPKGDAFADRNKYAMEIDFEEQPPMFAVSETHSAATWLLHPDAPKVDIPKNITDRIARMKKKNGGADNG